MGGQQLMMGELVLLLLRLSPLLLLIFKWVKPLEHFF